MKLLETISRWLNKLLVFIGGLLLVLMILLTCANIFTRLVWVPIRGTFELMGYAGAVVTAFALGYTQIRKGHISVDVLIGTFSDRTKRALDIVNHSVCLIFFAVATWQLAVKATTLWKTGEVTETLRIVYYPFTYAVALGCAVLALVLLIHLIKALMPRQQEENH